MKGEDVFDLKELQTQQVLTEQSGEPSPTIHSENKSKSWGRFAGPVLWEQGQVLCNTSVNNRHF